MIHVNSNGFSTHNLDSALDLFPKHIRDRFDNLDLKIKIIDNKTTVFRTLEFQVENTIYLQTWGASAAIQNYNSAKFLEETGPNILGIFLPITNQLMFRNHCGDDTIVHELGHALDKSLGPRPSNLIKPTSEFLSSTSKMMDIMSGKTISNYGLINTSETEYFAEAVRLYMNIPSVDRRENEPLLLKKWNADTPKQVLEIADPRLFMFLDKLWKYNVVDVQ